MESAIELHDLQFAYTSGQPILDIPHLQIQRGEKLFIYGPSGCGKTTFLGLIAGVLDLQGGRLSILGQEMQSKSHSEKDEFRGAHMGYIFQMFNLIPYLNAAENIQLPCRLNKQRASRLSQASEQALTTLARRLGIEKILHRSVQGLSVGQQQRVAAARALLGSPEIIIADEPTSALDSDHRQAFLNVLLQQASESGATVLFVSHDRELAKFFDRAISIPEINRVPRAGSRD